MSLQARAFEPVSSAGGSPRLRRVSLQSAALLSTVVWLVVLAVPGATRASEGQQAEPSSSAEGDERPSWLRPLGDSSEPRDELGGEGNSDYRQSWSKLEPGVLDVQAWDWLQQDLGRMLDLITEKTPNRLSPESFAAKYVSATAEFLEIDAAATQTFQAAVDMSLDEMDGARSNMLEQKSSGESKLDENAAMLGARTDWGEYRSAQNQAARHTLALLEERPRHELLREGMMKWLLRLAYGIGAAEK